MTFALSVGSGVVGVGSGVVTVGIVYGHDGVHIFQHLNFWVCVCLARTA